MYISICVKAFTFFQLAQHPHRRCTSNRSAGRGGESRKEKKRKEERERERKKKKISKDEKNRANLTALKTPAPHLVGWRYMALVATHAAREEIPGRAGAHAHALAARLDADKLADKVVAVVGRVAAADAVALERVRAVRVLLALVGGRHDGDVAGCMKFVKEKSSKKKKRKEKKEQKT